MQLEKKCLFCNQEFIAEKESRKYCSIRCSRSKHRETVNCPQCGDSFERIAGNKYPKYCNKECYYSAKIGSIKENKTGIYKVCETCKGHFYVYKSQVKFGNPRFCSDPCFYKWLKGSERTKRVDIFCPVCDKAIRIRQSVLDDGRKHYCSQECMMKERPKTPRVPKIERVCKYCNNVFYIYPSWAKKKNGGSFCSRSCSASYHIRKASLISPTSIEQALINELDSRNIKYEFQYPLNSWVIDFAIPEHSLAIEADGVYWHSLANVQEKDARKDADLKSSGWAIIHFTGDEIRESASSCVDVIESHIKSV